LNGEGLGLRTVATQKDGVVRQTAFLTTTDKEWLDLNLLPKIQKRIDQWRGTLYCVRDPVGNRPELLWLARKYPGILDGARGAGGNHRSELTHQWGDCCLVAGPFLFYGDRELLGRVHAALTVPPQPGE
jgi:hypothetical protein